MPRVDFYVLQNTVPEERLLFASRLAEKAYTLGHPIYFHCPSRSMARYLDDLLWAYRKNSFLPHALAEDVLPPIAPILIGDERGPEVTGTQIEEMLARMHTLLCAPNDVPPWEKQNIPGALLINLAYEVPSFFEHFSRIAELVDQDEKNLKMGRMRFLYYRERGITPDNHKLPPKEPKSR